MSSMSMPATYSRDEHVFMAKLAEQGERFDEMLAHMNAVAESGAELTVEERNLLSVAHKNVAGHKRAAIRIMQAIEGRENAADHKAKISEYRARIEQELEAQCVACVQLLDDKVLPANREPEAQVFFLKMKADYNRYRCEYLAGPERQRALGVAQAAYEAAAELAAAELDANNPIRLGLALNYSVFHYESIGDCVQACGIAKKAFDDALEGLDRCCNDTYRDSTLIMQLLRDNLTLWTSECDVDDDADHDA